MDKYFILIKTSAGLLLISSDEDAITGVCFETHKRYQEILENSQELEVPILKDAKKQLEEYFSGNRKIFNIPLKSNGTIFQKKVWDGLLKIPYGKILSYKDLAQNIDNIRAFRAAGNANSKNPISIIVPCHRVVGKNGTLTGYANGLDKKQYLLNIESKFNNKANKANERN
ncbi:MAG: methylated-DNA-[protein]-cysteine S-methyltransferase [Rickettsiales bacterium]|jgi:methylated-DNA-[protein]-cysteine S-methyltransferase